MSSDNFDRLILTCDALPLPPFVGHNRVVYELLQALDREEIEAVVYANDDEMNQLEGHWKGRRVRFHPLTRRMAGRHIRSVVQQLSLPTVTRDFDGEEKLVKTLARQTKNPRLLVHFITGAPLLERFDGRGVILSGHDCMSHVYLEEARHARNWSMRLRYMIRRRFARVAEKRLAHQAERVHLVSHHDMIEFKRVNPRIRGEVVPLGTEAPIPSKLQPFAERRVCVIWGTLSDELIIAGLRRLMAAAVRSHPSILRGWIVLGRVPEAEARALLPGLDRLGLIYRSHVPDLSAFLGATRLLLLPDVGGSGQKTRTLDGLAHGCCAMGLPIAFRGIENCPEPAYIQAATHGELLDQLALLSDVDAERSAARGRHRFLEEFDRPVLAKRWRKLLQGVGTFAPGY
ncbi:MAG: hypothetical protein EXS36_09460 [Pedosphaera sp.]|nr:hypothetical protein [Pedosphaera sp.]